VEAGLRQWLPPARVDEAIRLLAEAHAALIEALGPFSVPAPAAPEAEVDAQALGRVLAELRQHLSDGDPAAQELATAQAPLLRAALGAGWALFEESLRSFDFDEALQRLEPLKGAEGAP
jgi:hypothetical protein